MLRTRIVLGLRKVYRKNIRNSKFCSGDARRRDLGRRGGRVKLRCTEMSIFVENDPRVLLTFENKLCPPLCFSHGRLTKSHTSDFSLSSLPPHCGRLENDFFAESIFVFRASKSFDFFLLATPQKKGFDLITHWCCGADYVKALSSCIPTSVDHPDVENVREINQVYKNSQDNIMLSSTYSLTEISKPQQQQFHTPLLSDELHPRTHTLPDQHKYSYPCMYCCILPALTHNTLSTSPLNIFVHILVYADLNFSIISSVYMYEYRVGFD
ncbi:GDSL esterase/lipase [Actinidia chinensis var. chinensis]|uniref:GDSL esterase/lipase n=1 Tax=Actinidia chinensis var. chinensis TaxID=1590841 RepID=A0A2R6QLD4_ACTCC|nr:GDSL esterase/lipase [Actinidia chinensis var. chinensis]